MKIYYIASKQNNRSKLRIKLETMLACAFINYNNLYAKVLTVEDVENGIDSTGEKIFRVSIKICYWTCIIACICEMLMKIKDGDNKAIWGVLTKYAMLYGTVFLVRVILDTIGGVFS